MAPGRFARSGAENGWLEATFPRIGGSPRLKHVVRSACSRVTALALALGAANSLRLDERQGCYGTQARPSWSRSKPWRHSRRTSRRMPSCMCLPCNGHAQSTVIMILELSLQDSRDVEACRILKRLQGVVIKPSHTEPNPLVKEPRNEPSE